MLLPVLQMLGATAIIVVIVLSLSSSGPRPRRLVLGPDASFVVPANRRNRFLYGARILLTGLVAVAAGVSTYRTLADPGQRGAGLVAIAADSVAVILIVLVLATLMGRRSPMVLTSTGCITPCCPHTTVGKGRKPDSHNRPGLGQDLDSCPGLGFWLIGTSVCTYCWPSD